MISMNIQELSKLPAIFITGTDADIGKTIASAWLCHKLNADYFKPIQSGIQKIFPHTDSDFIKSLDLNIKVFDEIYKFEHTLSPHLSAQYAGINIDLNKIILPQSECKNTLIVEGAGGVLTPLNKNEYIADLIKKLDIPTIIICRSTLGTINHTCLTVKLLQSYNINIIGIIMVGIYNAENKKSIQHYTKIDIIAELPIFSQKNNWLQLKNYG